MMEIKRIKKKGKLYQKCMGKNQTNKIRDTRSVSC